MGVKVIAEGLNDARDLSVLEEVGVDGATGPLVSSALLQAPREAALAEPL
jgi:EAL domain-containing protein (putative c-di-GMP-specific phosphodiesterase class I)